MGSDKRHSITCTPRAFGANASVPTWF